MWIWYCVLLIFKDVTFLGSRRKSCSYDLLFPFSITTIRLEWTIAVFVSLGRGGMERAGVGWGRVGLGRRWLAMTYG